MVALNGDKSKGEITMAQYNCSACEELREDAPNLIVNGLGSTECASLKNNTGLNPSAGNDDCHDLDNLNDCLIGNMKDEIDAYDVCDWKEFMRKFIDNAWTVFKGIICAICGLWTNIANINARLKELCDLINANMSHPVMAYGTNPNISDASRIGGVIANKNGKPILTPLSRSEVSSEGAWEAQNVGFRYGQLRSTGCTSGCIRYEWIAPSVYAYRFNPEVEPAYDDMLWSIDKASVLGRMGMSQEMWNVRAENPIQWTADWTAGRAVIALRLSVENDRLVLRYRGAIGADDADLAGQTLIPPADQAERLYKFGC